MGKFLMDGGLNYRRSCHLGSLSCILILMMLIEDLICVGLWLGDLCKVDAVEPINQLFLGITPDRFHQAAVTENAGAALANAFIKQNWTVNGFNDIQQSDLLWRFGSDTPPRAPREVCSSPATDNWDTILARKEGGICFSLAIWLVAARRSEPNSARYTIARTA